MVIVEPARVAHGQELSVAASVGSPENGRSALASTHGVF